MLPSLFRPSQSASVRNARRPNRSRPRAEYPPPAFENLESRVFLDASYVVLTLGPTLAAKFGTPTVKAEAPQNHDNYSSWGGNAVAADNGWTWSVQVYHHLDGTGGPFEPAGSWGFVFYDGADDDYNSDDSYAQPQTFTPSSAVWHGIYRAATDSEFAEDSSLQATILNSATVTDTNQTPTVTATAAGGGGASLSFLRDASGNGKLTDSVDITGDSPAVANAQYKLYNDTGAVVQSGSLASGSTSITIPQPAAGHTDKFTLIDGIIGSAGTFIGNTATVQLASIMPTVTISGTSTKDASGKTVPDPRVNPTTNTITVLQDVTKQTQVTVNVSVTNAGVGLPDYFFVENIGTTPTPPPNTTLVTPIVTDILPVPGGAVGSYSTTISVPPNTTPGTYTWDFIDALHGNLKVTLTIVIVGPNA